MALTHSAHTHRHARGTVRLPEGWVDVSKLSGRYTEVQGAVYGKSCKAFVDQTKRLEKGRPVTDLSRMAEKAGTSEQGVKSGALLNFSSPGETKVYLLLPNDCCIDLEGEDHRSSPLTVPRPGSQSDRPASGAVIGCGMAQAIEALFIHHGCHRAGSTTVRGSLKPTDQFHKVEGQPTSTEAEESLKQEAEAREEEQRHEAEVAEADA